MAERTPTLFFNRQTLGGTSTVFKFGIKADYFVVKNFSGNPLFFAFTEITDEAEAIKIPSGGYQIIPSIDKDGIDIAVDTVYCKGTGEVEVDIYAEAQI